MRYSTNTDTGSQVFVPQHTSDNGCLRNSGQAVLALSGGLGRPLKLLATTVGWTSASDYSPEGAGCSTFVVAISGGL